MPLVRSGSNVKSDATREVLFHLQRGVREFRGFVHLEGRSPGRDVGGRDFGQTGQRSDLGFVDVALADVGYPLDITRLVWILDRGGSNPTRGTCGDSHVKRHVDASTPLVESVS